MDKTLKLYYNNGSSDVPFPQGLEQAELFDFSVSISRMGTAPTISANLEYPICLDGYWNNGCAFDDVFVTFKGERYYLKNTPSSEKSNDKAFYVHSLNFVCERNVLENVYVLDDNENQTDNKLFSNNTNFTFFGNIADYAERINQSMYFSGIGDTCMYNQQGLVPIPNRVIVGDGYYIVVDSGVTSEEKLVTFNDNKVSDALSQIFSTYEIPYYFVGKIIHIGNFQSITEQTPTYAVGGILGAKIEDGALVPYEYGHEHSILSVNRNNASKEVYNRCSGYGSSDNIPYYYPNPTPTGTIHHNVTAQAGSTLNNNSVTVNDYLKFSSLNESDALKYVISSVASTDHINVKGIYVDDRLYQGGFFIDFPFDDLGSGGIEYYGVRILVRVDFEVKKEYDIIGLNFPTMFQNGTRWTLKRPDGVAINSTPGQLQRYCRVIRQQLVDSDGNYSLGTYKLSFEIDKEPATPQTPQVYFDLSGLITDINAGDGTQGNPYLWFGSTSNSQHYWSLQSNNQHVSIEDYGITIANGVTLANGDLIKKVVDKYVVPQEKLMPSCYRISDGATKFYPARNYPFEASQGVVADDDIGEYISSGNVHNDNYKDGSSQYYHFDNVMRRLKQKEHIEAFDDIKPSINGITNQAGRRIDMFASIAYDTNDDNSGYIDENNNFVYNHPYFFVKLRQFNGQNGFNLFDHAIDESEMVISMTSGDCAPCEFKIIVNEEQKNIVQVDGNGDLLRDSDGDVIMGRKNDARPPQDEQNDTSTYSVWIALEKDIETYGEIMPFNGNVIVRPKACTNAGTDDGDTFVILHIDMPFSYVTAAEQRLTAAIIEWMNENNSENFNLSMKFSRVFLGHNQSLEALLSENIKVKAKYNGITKEYFVSTFTYKMQPSSPLPEIELTGLVETIEELKSQASTGNFMKKIGEHISENFDSLMMGINKPFYKIIKQNNTNVNNYIKGEMPGDYAITKDSLDEGGVILGAGGRYIKRLMSGNDGQILKNVGGIVKWADSDMQHYESELQSDFQCTGVIADTPLRLPVPKSGMYAIFVNLQIDNTTQRATDVVASIKISDKDFIDSAKSSIVTFGRLNIATIASLTNENVVVVSVNSQSGVYLRKNVSDGTSTFNIATSLRMIKIC